MGSSPETDGDPLATAASAALRDAARYGRAPYLSVLGPSLSGKTRVMQELRAAVPTIFPGAASVGIDLRALAVGTNEEMYLQLWQLMRDTDGHGRLASTTRPVVSADALTLALRDVLCAHDGRLLFFVDHLERVPRYFARSMTRALRHCHDVADSVIEYKRLGAIVAGSLSMFELTRATESAPTMFDVFHLPVFDRKQQHAMIQWRLAHFHLTADEAAVAALLHATSGEMAFLDAILQEIDDTPAVTEERIRHAAERLSALDSPIPELRHVGLSVALDADLREIATNLLAHRPAYAREPNVDIDRLQLTGAVVLQRNGTPRAYRFRNGIVERYVSAVTQDLRPTHLGALANGRERADANGASNGNTGHRVLERLTRELHQSDDVWAALDGVEHAWSSIVPFGKPELSIALPGEDDRMAYLVNATRGVDTSPDGDGVSPAARMVATGAARRNRPYFGSHDDRIAVAVPLGPKRRDPSLIVQVRRAGQRRQLSESSLDHWIQLISGIGRLLALPAYEEMYRRGAVEISAQRPLPRVFSPTAEDAQPLDVFVAMPFADDMAFVFEDHIRGLCRKLKVTVKRGDDFFSGEHVISEVRSAIARSRVVIADCTGRNPNVFYEIGLAHELDKPVVLVTQKLADVPFDIRHLRVIEYGTTPREVKQFEHALRETLRTILALK